MPSFTKWFGGLKPISLTASVLFFPPFIRDIACWAGFRQVGGTINRSLNVTSVALRCTEEFMPAIN
jgi:hypothetical protein